LWYNIFRAFSSGFVLAALSAILFPQDASLFYLLFPAFWALFFLIAFLPIGIVLAALSSVSGWFGIFGIFIAIFTVSIGDPLICLLHSLFPRIVPVSDPPLFSTHPIFWVIDSREYVIAS
jgi:hypothetical protein